MALFREHQILIGETLCLECVHQHLRLVGGYHGVGAALEHDHGARQLVGVVDGGPVAVDGFILRPPPHQAVEVPGLKLVGVGRKGGEVRHSVPGRPGGEGVVAHQGGQHRESAGAATPNGEPSGVHIATIGEEGGCCHTVVDVGETPLAVEGPHVLASVAGAAAVIHIDHRPPAAGPVAGVENELIARCRCGATVGAHEQRRQIGLRPLHRVVCRRVEQCVGHRVVGGGKRDGFGRGEHLGRQVQRAGAMHHRGRTVGGETHHLTLAVVAAHHRHRCARGRSPQRRDGASSDPGVHKHRSGGGVARGGPVAKAVSSRGTLGEPKFAGTGEDHAGQTEDPVRRGDLELPGDRTLKAGALEVGDPVQVVPALVVRGDPQRGVGSPYRHGQRGVAVAADAPGVTQFGCVFGEVGEPQLGAVPGHVGQIPLNPRKAGAVGRHAG